MSLPLMDDWFLKAKSMPPADTGYLLANWAIAYSDNSMECRFAALRQMNLRCSAVNGLNSME